MDRAQWAKYQKETDYDRRLSIAYERQSIARFVARLYGDKSMDPLPSSASSWLTKLSESAKEFIANRSEQTKAALYKSLKSTASRSQFNDDPEFEPYRLFTAGDSPDTTYTVPEYTGDNVILKGIHRAYNVLLGNGR